MKKILIALFILIVNRGFSQVESNANSSATVIIYRPTTDWEHGANAAIFVNDEKICKLGWRRYIAYKAKLGTLTINVHCGGFSYIKKEETQVRLEVEAGKTYYIACKSKGGLGSKFEMWEVPESTAKADIAKLRPDRCMSKIKSPFLGFSQVEGNINPSATVIFYRRSSPFSHGGLANFAIFANGKKICKLSHNKYVTYEAKSSRLTLKAHSAGFEPGKIQGYLELEVEAGKTYYVECDFRIVPFSRWGNSIVEMSEVPESTAKVDLAKLKPDHCIIKRLNPHSPISQGSLLK